MASRIELGHSLNVQAASLGPSSESSLARGLVLVALAEPGSDAPEHLMHRLRAAGATVYVTHGWDGCLRVATAVQPRVIYLERALPDRVRSLLQAHPHSKRALICPLAEAAC